jgi:hypothetical protein
MSELPIDVRLIAELVGELDVTVTTEALPDLSTSLTCWASLEETNQELSTIRAVLAGKVAAAMPDRRITVLGVGTFERYRRADRKKWDKDLYRAVLDTRLVDAETGVMLDETPLGKVLAVWNLGAPRVTALRARGLDPDEWCEVEYGRVTLRRVG